MPSYANSTGSRLKSMPNTKTHPIKIFGFRVRRTFDVNCKHRHKSVYNPVIELSQ